MDYEAYRGRGVRKVDSAPRPVEHLENVSEWVQDIYCLAGEDNVYSADKVMGGRDGVSNAPIQALANRTVYLKDTIIKLTEYIKALTAAASSVLSNVKAAVVSKNAPANVNNYMWIKSTNSAAYTTGFKITLKNGNVINNPIFRITVGDGALVYYVRTDGVTGDLGDINFNQFEEV